MPAKIASKPFPTFVLRREQEILEELRQAFRKRYLPEHLFYWLPASVQAWIDLCRSSEYRNASRALEVLRTAAPEIAQLSSQITSICGIGCGEGSKDLILLEECKRAGRPLNFVAADFSQTLMELAVDQAYDTATLAMGVKLNVFDDEHLQLLIQQTRELSTPVLFSILGNTLGAFDIKHFPVRLRALLEQQDRFLFDGELFTESTLAGYDNPTNRRFAWGPLTGVGITEEDGRLEFATESMGSDLFAVTKHFIASRDLCVNLGGEVIEISAGEKLRMSSSIKYRNEAVLMAFVESAGFEVTEKWQSKDGSFVLGYAKPK
jgi:uncharacterized SAM-dependent methyltransferase